MKTFVCFPQKMDATFDPYQSDAEIMLIRKQIEEQTTKYIINTGEDDETVLYAHRAKLLRFSGSQWKQRGLGDVTILKHKYTGKLRVVMRNDEILNVCLNHILDNDVAYKPKQTKSWLFMVNDYSEGEYELLTLCLQFKTPEIAESFKRAIDDALATRVIEEHAFYCLDEDEKRKIHDLRLPFNFYDFKKVAKCVGCRGCQPGEFKCSFKESAVDLGSDEQPLPLIFKAITITDDSDEIKNLKLPNDFFQYRNNTECTGCRGCDSDAFIFSSVENNNSNIIGEDVNALPLYFKKK